MSKSKLIILASTSPFRKALLSEAGISFEAIAAVGDEHSVKGLPPSALALKRAEFKALDVATRCQKPCIVIGADQVLGLNGKSYDKAHSALEAEERLQEFQGQTHYLHSAFSIVDVSKVDSEGAVRTTILSSKVVDIPMTMKKLSTADIKTYVDTSEWQGCVGCYRIEGEGRKLFATVGASESAIIGLPMKELTEELSKYIENISKK